LPHPKAASQHTESLKNQPEGPADQGSGATTNYMESFCKQQGDLIRALQAPKLEIPCVDGNPLRYHPFILSFEENVVNAISDAAAKLAQLIKLCTGKVGRLLDIECCLLMPLPAFDMRKPALLFFPLDYGFVPFFPSFLLATSNGSESDAYNTIHQHAICHPN